MLDSQLDLLQQHLIVEKGLSRNTLTAYMSDLQHFGVFVQARSMQNAVSKGWQPVPSLAS
jgi:site-specific recombinase XerD